jgi:hypothetical protein
LVAGLSSIGPLVLVALAGCGRLGFGTSQQSDASAQVDDGDLDPDAIGPTDDASIDAPPPPAATINFISSASATNNAATYTFNDIDIGAAAADRIVVVCAFLGGGAITQITSITVGGVALTLTGRVTDGVSGSWAFGYGALPTGAAATITVTSANAGRAAIAVYKVTATSTIPTDTQTDVDAVDSAGSISTMITAQPGGVIIANAGYGSNTPTWLWSGSWSGYSVNLNTFWAGEQGTYTTAAASTTVGGTFTITATPSSSTPKVINAISWR